LRAGSFGLTGNRRLLGGLLPAVSVRARGDAVAVNLGQRPFRWNPHAFERAVREAEVRRLRSLPRPPRAWADALLLEHAAHAGDAAAFARLCAAAALNHGTGVRWRSSAAAGDEAAAARAAAAEAAAVGAARARLHRYGGGGGGGGGPVAASSEDMREDGGSAGVPWHQPGAYAALVARARAQAAAATPVSRGKAGSGGVGAAVADAGGPGDAAHSLALDSPRASTATAAAATAAGTAVAGTAAAAGDVREARAVVVLTRPRAH
jgi:hypothetical protein